MYAMNELGMPDEQKYLWFEVRFDNRFVVSRKCEFKIVPCLYYESNKAF